MKFPVHSLVLTALITCGLSANAASIKQPSTKASSSFVVETPQQLPELAQTNGEALYPHESTNGRAVLYIEGINGTDLRVLDVVAYSSTGQQTRARAVPRLGPILC